jgi:ubiquinone/menaquinone biosynthesis C-methylase UbiE
MSNPTPLPPEQNAEAWSSVAETYDLFAEAVTRSFAEDAVRLVYLGQGSEVIDVAAGTGMFTLIAARRGANVLATDFSEGMVHRLTHKCAEQRLTTVKTAVMDGQALKVADSSFDVAASLFGLMLFPNHDQGLRELLRVLKPGGQAVVTIWAPSPRNEMQQIMGRLIAKAMPELPTAATPSLPTLSVGTQAGSTTPDKPPPWAALGDVDDLRLRLLSIGFAHAHVVSVRHLWTFESPEWLVKFMPSIAPGPAAFFETLTTGQQEALQRAFVEDFRERQGGGPYGVTNEGLIAIGTKAAV